MQKLELTKKEIKLLIEMEYLSDWIKNSPTSANNISNNEEKLTQKIYKLAYESGYSDLIEYDKDEDYYFPTDKFDEEMDPIIDTYNSDFILDSMEYLDKLNDKLLPVNINSTNENKKKIGLNELCHCGSDKKYKKCCLDKNIVKSNNIIPLNEVYKKSIYQIKISLNDTDVWRRFLVRSDILLPEFHDVIQIIMGWENYHLHQFVIDKMFYGIKDDEFGDDDRVIEYKNVKLCQVLNNNRKKIIYEYDFGDNWEHSIELEKVLPIEDKNQNYPICIDGEKACPPEDCGSIPGYEDILSAMKDKTNPEYEDILSWVGEDYNPDFFNKDEINKMLID